MTQEEKFKEAKRLYETANADQRYVLESLFPELKNPEDERIRKELIEFVKSRGGFKQEYIAWLEKQGEKEYGWSEEDEALYTRCLGVLGKCKCGISVEKVDEEINWLKSLSPQSQWKPSERQKEALLWCVVHLGGADKQTLGELLEELNKL